MAKFDIPSDLLKGLEEDQQSQSAVKNITMLRCLRWVMKKHGMTIEIKTARSYTDASNIIRLAKYDTDMHLIDTIIQIDITDYRLERGLFELELAIMEHTNLKPANWLSSIFGLIQRNKIIFPPHNILLDEIVLNGHTFRICCTGTDPDSGNDLFSGFLLSDDKIVLSTEPQVRMGSVLDNMENAVMQKRRDGYRKGMFDIMLKIGSD